MSKGSLNKVMLIGRLGVDPELKYTPQGTAVCNFNLATDESYKDQQGNAVDKTEWHKIVLWRKLAEIAGQFLKKGSLIYLEGSITTRSWEQDGQKKYVTEIIAVNMTMLDSNQEKAKPQKQKEQAKENPMAEDDDLPF